MTNIESICFVNDNVVVLGRIHSLMQFCSFPVQAFTKFRFCLGGRYYTLFTVCTIMQMSGGKNKDENEPQHVRKLAKEVIPRRKAFV